MKKTSLLATAAAMLLSSCMVRINSTHNALKPAASAEEAISMADSAAAKGFTRIEANGGFDVYYTRGDTLSIRLEGDTASTRHTIVTGDGKTLTISAANDGDLTTKLKYQMKVYVTSPALTEVSIKGSGNFIAERGISAEKLSMHIAGSGDIKVKGVKADDFSIDIAGSGDAYASGINAKKTYTSIAGSGGITMDGIKADNFTGSIAGSGDIKATRADIGKASCSIAGSGDIAINGSVKECEKSVAGSGSVKVTK